MWENSQRYGRLDGALERVEWHASGEQIIRYNNQALSPVLLQESGDEALVIVHYLSHHQEPLSAWLANSISHGIAKVQRVKVMHYEVDGVQKSYYLANLQTAQAGYDGVSQQSTIYSLEERMVGSSIAGHIIVERLEMSYGYASTHRLYRYRCTRQRR